MNHAAERMETGYAQIKDDPQARAAQDQTLVTTEGVRMSGEMFRDAASKASNAHDALTQIEEYEGD